jgi:3-oxoacyl-[acyl-carrier-protein] synthase-3
MGPGSARITGWGHYAPETVLTNADLERLVETSDEWIVSRTGIRERRVAGPGESTATLGAIAGNRAVAVAGIQPDQVDMILVATATPDYQLPSTAALVKEAMGATRAAAMDVGAVCSGFVYALTAAHAYVASGMYRNVVVIGAEVLTRYMDYTDRNTCVLFGDGAGAVVVSASDEHGGGLLGFELTADPEGAYNIWMPAGGSRNPPRRSTIDRRGHYLRMDGRETYRYATRTLASSARTALERAGIHSDDIALFIPHQANIRIIESVAKQLGISMDRVYVNVDRYGNTSAASVPIALAEAVDEGRVQPGDRIVFVAFGSGYTSGAAVIEWTADPANGRRADTVSPYVTIHQPADWTPDDATPPELQAILSARRHAAGAGVAGLTNAPNVTHRPGGTASGGNGSRDPGSAPVAVTATGDRPAS